MDDVLTRMLTVEQEADRLAAAAEAEAEALRDQGRRQAEDDKAALLRDIEAEAQRLVAQQVAAAETNREETLRRAEPRLEQQAAAFAQAIAARAALALRHLAYPGAVEGG